ncbi:hypothetical protein HK105_208012 [Polyrhizophydium stewartii]|uniref:Ankyrin repeat protein n=1 Tax=Polyrhizophydium stewartii TaxID=2732419 RepID=A0ABR4MZ12_9FUNG
MPPRDTAAARVRALPWFVRDRVLQLAGTAAALQFDALPRPLPAAAVLAAAADAARAAGPPLAAAAAATACPPLPPPAELPRLLRAAAADRALLPAAHSLLEAAARDLRGDARHGVAVDPNAALAVAAAAAALGRLDLLAAAAAHLPRALARAPAFLAALHAQHAALAWLDAHADTTPDPLPDADPVLQTMRLPPWAASQLAAAIEGGHLVLARALHAAFPLDLPFGLDKAIAAGHRHMAAWVVDSGWAADLSRIIRDDPAAPAADALGDLRLWLAEAGMLDLLVRAIDQDLGDEISPARLVAVSLSARTGTRILDWALAAFDPPSVLSLDALRSAACSDDTSLVRRVVAEIRRHAPSMAHLWLQSSTVISLVGHNQDIFAVLWAEAVPHSFAASDWVAVEAAKHGYWPTIDFFASRSSCDLDRCLSAALAADHLLLADHLLASGRASPRPEFMTPIAAGGSIHAARWLHASLARFAWLSDGGVIKYPPGAVRAAFTHGVPPMLPFLVNECGADLDGALTDYDLEFAAARGRLDALRVLRESACGQPDWRSLAIAAERNNHMQLVEWIRTDVLAAEPPRPV